VETCDAARVMDGVRNGKVSEFGNEALENM
jgi:hypothetical protein